MDCMVKLLSTGDHTHADQQMCLSAIRIQSIVRGYLTRKKLAEAKQLFREIVEELSDEELMNIEPIIPPSISPHYAPRFIRDHQHIHKQSYCLRSPRHTKSLAAERQEMNTYGLKSRYPSTAPSPYQSQSDSMINAWLPPVVEICGNSNEAEASTSVPLNFHLESKSYRKVRPSVSAETQTDNGDNVSKATGCHPIIGSIRGCIPKSGKLKKIKTDAPVIKINGEFGLDGLETSSVVSLATHLKSGINDVHFPANKPRWFTSGLVPRKVDGTMADWNYVVRKKDLRLKNVECGKSYSGFKITAGTAAPSKPSFDVVTPVHSPASSVPSSPVPRGRSPLSNGKLLPTDLTPPSSPRAGRVSPRSGVQAQSARTEQRKSPGKISARNPRSPQSPLSPSTQSKASTTLTLRDLHTSQPSRNSAMNDAQCPYRLAPVSSGQKIQDSPGTPRGSNQRKSQLSRSCPSLLRLDFTAVRDPSLQDSPKAAYPHTVIPNPHQNSPQLKNKGSGNTKAVDTLRQQNRFLSQGQVEKVRFPSPVKSPFLRSPISSKAADVCINEDGQPLDTSITCEHGPTNSSQQSSPVKIEININANCRNDRDSHSSSPVKLQPGVQSSVSAAVRRNLATPIFLAPETEPALGESRLQESEHLPLANIQSSTPLQKGGSSQAAHLRQREMGGVSISEVSDVDDTSCEHSTSLWASQTQTKSHQTIPPRVKHCIQNARSGSNMLSQDGLSSPDKTAAELKAVRDNAALELVWIEQAIASRKQYLELKKKLRQDPQ